MSRIAVIGAGISGMATAYLLSQKHEVWLFEKESRLGGHTHTHDIGTSQGVLPIDTGFIVHNDRTYPNLVRLFRKLGVERQPSDMSFGVSCRDTGFEYSTRGLGGFFGNNLLRFRQYRLFAEILRFNREARRLLRDPGNAGVTLGHYVRAHGFEGDFASYYLNPMAASVWSTSLDEIEDFPAFTLFRFLDNHGLLGITTQAQWYVLKGGSSIYVEPLTAPYRERIRLGAKIEAVRRNVANPLSTDAPGTGPRGAGPRGSIDIFFADQHREQFDEVVFASHAPQTLQLLKDASAAERQVLGNFRTSPNRAVLHTDSHLLPQSPSARASWNYHLGTSRSSATLTYHMNRLQSLPTPEDYCVTLNDAGSVDKGRILREMEYWHPLYTLDAVRAQSRWSEISGQKHTHFCGAYWFYGFHEDGLNSAIRVAESLGVSWDQVV